jgi:hypothetical protein
MQVSLRYRGFKFRLTTPRLVPTDCASKSPLSCCARFLVDTSDYLNQDMDSKLFDDPKLKRHSSKHVPHNSLPCLTEV